MFADGFLGRESVEFITQLLLHWAVRSSAVLLVGVLVVRLCIHRSAATKP